jgi:RecQ family ATP-dependent DNA helicase
MLEPYRNVPLVGAKDNLLILPARDCLPIEDLKVFKDGLSCQQCDYVCVSEERMEKHCRKEHGWKKSRKQGMDDRPWQKTWCQQFFRSQGRRYFAVATPIEMVNVASQLDQLRAQAKEKLDICTASLKEKQRIIAEGERTEVNSWLDATEWITHLAGRDRMEMAKKVSLPKDGESVLSMVSESIQRLVMMARQTVMQKKVNKFELTTMNGFQKGVESNRPLQVKELVENTVEKYTRVWQRLICYVLRMVDDPAPLFSLLDRQRQALDDLLKEAEEQAKRERERTEEGTRAEGVIEERRVVEEDRNLLLPVPREPSEGPEETAELDGRCLRFCIELLDHRLNQSEYENAIVSFLAVLGIEGQDQWTEPGNYTPHLSGLIKIAQLFVIQLGYERKRDDEVESSMDEIEIMHDRFMTTGTKGPMNWALQLRLLGRKIKNMTTEQGHVDWIEVDDCRMNDHIIFKDVELEMPKFRQGLQDLIEETRQDMLKKLLLLKDEELPPLIDWSQMRDNPSNGHAGWNFIQHKVNKLEAGQDWLWDRVFEDVELAHEFIHEQNRISWRMERVEEYMAAVAEFGERLWVGTQMSGGQPARATELLSLRYCNTMRGGHRSIFVENGLMSFVTKYHKGYSISGSEKIIHRYLPQEVGELLFYYIWLVLPFRQRLQMVVYGEEELSPFLWSQDPAKWTEDRCRKVLKRESILWMNTVLTVSSYRHVAIAISRRYMRRGPFVEDEEEEKMEDDIADKQASHTLMSAGAIYARLLDEARGHVASERERYRVSSVAWHEWQGWASALAQRLKRKRESGSMDESIEIRQWKRRRELDMSAELQRFMGPTAAFRGRQTEAIQAIMQGRRPIVVIMGTGCGKSLLFMLPASIAGEGTTIVVVPLVSLRGDLLGRCQALGIDSVEWNAEQPNLTASLVFVTPESAVSKGFTSYVSRLRREHRLDRIVIDECHTVLKTSMSFRKRAREIGQLVKAGVQMVMLTATLPPRKQEELLKTMSLSSAIWIRGSTSRSNIRYTVQTYKTDLEVTQLVQVRLARYECSEKIIVYCQSLDRMRAVALLLNCPMYHAAAEDKDEIFQALREGRQPVIVATNALGLGIDLPDVRLVLHVDAPRELDDYGQESGRAGRDGEASEAIMLVKSIRRKEGVSTADEQDMQHYITARGCRRRKLDGCMDGHLERIQCLDKEERCDLCRRRERLEVAGQVELTVEERVEFDQQQEVSSEMKWTRQEQERIRCEEIVRLEKKLRWLKQRCVYCHRYGHDSRHRLKECQKEGGQEAYRGFEWMQTQLGQRVYFEKWTCCFRCHVPQSICQEGYRTGRCEYGGVVLACGAVMMVDDRALDVMEKMGAPRDYEKLLSWYGKMTEIGGKQASNLARAFLTLF